MAVIPLYRDMLRTLSAAPYGAPVWPRFARDVYHPHRAFFEGLTDTYGDALFGPAGLPGAVEQMAPALTQSLRWAPSYDMETTAQRWLDAVDPLLPWTQPDLYLGSLFFMAPAATMSVHGRPAMALGLERFHPSPPPTGAKYWYHPAEVAEMIPHEAAHVARMQSLDLPPTPRRLSLLDMVMLEGTALTFTDQLLGRQTLATFLPPDRLAWHQANDAAVRAAAAPDFPRGGMEIFLKYFTERSPISGYYVGYSLCSEFLNRYGPDSIRQLIAMPSDRILSALPSRAGGA